MCSSRVSTSKNSFNAILSIKTNCQAKINVIVDNNWRFTISRVHLEHLARKNLVFKIFNKKMDTYVERSLKLNDQASISLSKIFNSLWVKSGGYENLTYTKKIVEIILWKQGSLGLELEMLKHLETFSLMQRRNLIFFFIWLMWIRKFV